MYSVLEDITEEEFPDVVKRLKAVESEQGNVVKTFEEEDASTSYLVGKGSNPRGSLAKEITKKECEMLFSKGVIHAKARDAALKTRHGKLTHREWLFSSTHSEFPDKLRRRLSKITAAKLISASFLFFSGILFIASGSSITGNFVAGNIFSSPGDYILFSVVAFSLASFSILSIAKSREERLHSLARAVHGL
ncbi:MAG TPA: hypothetical protein ENN46_03040 [Candidatus Woesearchaeota archaeon]|nr:hypothetical protein [Candidatus Woesearchaeota archaeon]